MPIFGALANISFTAFAGYGGGPGGGGGDPGGGGVGFSLPRSQLAISPTLEDHAISSIEKNPASIWYFLLRYGYIEENEWNPELIHQIWKHEIVSKYLKDYTTEGDAPFNTTAEYFNWAVDLYNKKNIAENRPIFSQEEMKSYMRFLGHEYTNLQYLVSYSDLRNDIEILAKMINADHPDVSAIAGIPRSGMMVASDLAVRLGVELWEATEENGLRQMGSGLRFKGDQEGVKLHGQKQPHDEKMVLVDDSIASGYAINKIYSAHPQLRELPFYTVYATETNLDLISSCAAVVNLPHWFDWNLFNNGQIFRNFNMGLDFDGVLCEDCPLELDNDDEGYVEWLTNVRATRFPRDYQVPLIITARLEKYRQLTEQWLESNKINCSKLIMFPDSYQNRLKTDIGEWKAKMIKDNNCRLFVESDYNLALRISEIVSDIRVISVTKP